MVQQFPEPEEVIPVVPIPQMRNHSPPSLEAMSSRESQAIVVDIHVPGDEDAFKIVNSDIDNKIVIPVPAERKLSKVEFEEFNMEMNESYVSFEHTNLSPVDINAIEEDSGIMNENNVEEMMQNMQATEEQTITVTETHQDLTPLDATLIISPVPMRRSKKSLARAKKAMTLPDLVSGENIPEQVVTPIEELTPEKLELDNAIVQQLGAPPPIPISDEEEIEANGASGDEINEVQVQKGDFRASKDSFNEAYKTHEEVIDFRASNEQFNSNNRAYEEVEAQVEFLGPNDGFIKTQEQIETQEDFDYSNNASTFEENEGSKLSKNPSDKVPEIQIIHTNEEKEVTQIKSPDEEQHIQIFHELGLEVPKPTHHEEIEQTILLEDEIAPEDDQTEESITSFNEPLPEFLLKPEPMKRSSSLEILGTNEEPSAPEPPPRIKIYPINPTNPVPTKREIKSILKIRENKTVTFDETYEAYSPVYSPGLTTPEQVHTPPILPAPVLMAPGSPPLVPKEYRRGLLQRISESESSGCETDSLEGGNKVEEKEVPNNGKKLIIPIIEINGSDHEEKDETNETEVRRDYVNGSLPPPTNLREMRKQMLMREELREEALI